MKFVVDSLPCYGDDCPFTFNLEDSYGYGLCSYKNNKKCPRYWDKEFICSENNPHKCEYLIECIQYKGESYK